MAENKAKAMAFRANEIEETLIEIYSMLTEPDKMTRVSCVAKMIAECAAIAEEMSVELSASQA
jgi:hypothetical protein